MAELPKRPFPPPPYKTPYLDANGLISTEWQKWINEAYVRSGGKSALSNLQLEQLIDELDARVTALEQRLLMGLGKIVGRVLGMDSGSGQAAAAAEANRVNKEIYDSQRKDLSGYRDLGQYGLSELMGNMNAMTDTFGPEDFQKDPGYDFRMQEGQKALERSSSARGNLLGGGTAKALARYGQDYASNEYNNAYNRFNQDRDQRYGKLMDLVGTGQNAAAQTGAAGQNYASAYGQNVIGGANAKAAANMAQTQMGLDLGKQVAAAFSDARLKTKIEKLEHSIYKNVPTYRFEYRDEKYGSGTHVGVMAQDLLRLDPRHPAVTRDRRSGYLKVNYSMLEAE